MLQQPSIKPLKKCLTMYRTKYCKVEFIRPFKNACSITVVKFYDADEDTDKTEIEKDLKKIVSSFNKWNITLVKENDKSKRNKSPRHILRADITLGFDRKIKEKELLTVNNIISRIEEYLTDGKL